MSGTADQEQGYVHGYARDEQYRLIEQAEFWKDSLILNGTTLVPGERLLEIGSGAGAVLGVLGTAFPAAALTGVDISAEQVAFARSYLSERGVRADLRVASAFELPFASASFDRVWTMWFLEHLRNGQESVSALREARRVLVPGGTITSIETDYSTFISSPPDPDIDALRASFVRTFRAFGQSDAGTQLGGWLKEAGFRDICLGEHRFSYRGVEAGPPAQYVADMVETTITGITSVPGNASEQTLRRAVGKLRKFSSVPGAEIRVVVHKTQASA